MCASAQDGSSSLACPPSRSPGTTIKQVTSKFCLLLLPATFKLCAGLARVPSSWDWLDYTKNKIGQNTSKLRLARVNIKSRFGQITSKLGLAKKYLQTRSNFLHLQGPGFSISPDQCFNDQSSLCCLAFHDPSILDKLLGLENLNFKSHFT